MNKNWVLTQESFDDLLDWLDPQREQAGQKYEDIRCGLIKIFTSRGCLESEDLADETINRVTSKLKQIEGDFIGDPARYFYGVANKVHLEYLRRKPVQPPTVLPLTSDAVEQEFECLERCMEQLTPENRELVLQYYQEEKKARIDHRKLLAEKLGIAVNALRIRACRIRASIQECVQACLKRTSG